MTKVHREAYLASFGFTLSSEAKGNTKCQRWKNAAKLNLIISAISYIPIVNIIALSIIFAKSNKEENGKYLKSENGKAALARVILCSLGLIPVVMLMDIVGAIMKCCQKRFPKEEPNDPLRAQERAPYPRGNLKVPNETQQRNLVHKLMPETPFEDVEFLALPSEDRMNSLMQKLESGQAQTIHIR